MATAFERHFGAAMLGAEDVGRSAMAGPGEAWQSFLTATPPPGSHVTGQMEYTTGPQETVPQSYSAALREHAANEQADIRARHEAARQGDPGSGVAAPVIEKPDIGPPAGATPQAGAALSAFERATNPDLLPGPTQTSPIQENSHEPEL